jgi:hypothetical protein
MTLLLMNNPQEYIGNLFEVETQDENSILLYFDVFIGNRETVLNYTTDSIQQAETGFIRMELTNEQFSDIFKLNVSRARTLVDYWYELRGNTIKADNSIEANFYTYDFTIDNQPQISYFNNEDINVINRRKKEDKDFLNKINSLVDLKDIYDKKKTEIAITEFTVKMKSITDFTEVNVVSFNVGQGNATGIFDKDLNPILYYDLGGGAYWNKRTYPTIKDFPVNGDPFIILSHWDFDHYESIKANIGRYRNCKIIAPLQGTTPSIRKFASSIASNLYLIDKELLKGKNYQFLRMFKCTGKDRNDSGLGVRLNLNKNDDNISEILLPEMHNIST